jgi:DNA-binding transcriptional ArsR family regulator
MNGNGTSPWPIPLEEVLRALANPDRARILSCLCEGAPRTRSEIARRVGETVQFVGNHLQILVAADLVTSTQGSGRAKIYVAREPVVIPAAAWAELPASVRKGVGARIFSVIEREIAEALEAGLIAPDQAHISLTPMYVDERGEAAVLKLLDRVSDELLAIQEANDPREGDGKGRSLTLGLLAFPSAREAEIASTAPLKVAL